MKTLLLTDLPPCSNYTAGLVTAQMCRAVPPDGLAMFCVLNRHLTPEPCADLGWIPSRIVTKPNEVGVRAWRGWKLGEAGAVGIELYKRAVVIRRLIREAIAFGKAVGVGNLWCVLQGQTMLRMALPVARGLGVPLRLHIWDPLDWWHRAHLVDRVNARLDIALFDRTLRAGTTCASASWAMTEHYARRYGLQGEPVIAALDLGLMRRPPPRPHHADKLVIGMAGQFYAKDEWLALVEMLHYANWSVGGRRVVLCAMGRDAPPGAIPPENLDFRGWQSQPETVRILAEECDLLYCGYPFAAEMAEVSRLSFPSKLPTFFAAGRPVLFHGPADSSPATYLVRRGAAWLTTRPGGTALHTALLNLVEDEALFARLCAASTAAFLADFTLETQRAAVRRFLGLAPDATTKASQCSP